MPPLVYRHDFRVVMGEVDVSQIHFTAMHRWMDRGWSEWLALAGHPFPRILEEGPGVPIVETRCRFLLRVMLDDVLTLRTWVTGIGNTSFRTRHQFRRDGEVAVDGEMVHVCVDRDTRDTLRVPDWITVRAVLEGQEPGAD
ncbi:MAG: acyl-CoA thioesterase [Miltoncostaeaceae bacterium]